MILDDLKAFICDAGIVDESAVKYDYDSTSGENVVVLWLNGSEPCDLARYSTVQVTVKNLDLDVSRLVCEEIFKLIYPDEIFQKAVKINDKIMHVRALKSPYYLQKDTSGRHCYVFNIALIYENS